MKVRINTLTPELFLELYTSVGWEPPGIEQIHGFEERPCEWDGPGMFKMIR